jgi:hypothetical protein
MITAMTYFLLQLSAIAALVVVLHVVWRLADRFMDHVGRPRSRRAARRARRSRTA